MYCGIAGEKSKSIPDDARHWVLLDTYFGPFSIKPFKDKIHEVMVLGKGGLELIGY
jgi:hypothetical protein